MHKVKNELNISWIIGLVSTSLKFPSDLLLNLNLIKEIVRSFYYDKIDQSKYNHQLDHRFAVKEAFKKI